MGEGGGADAEGRAKAFLREIIDIIEYPLTLESYVFKDLDCSLEVRVALLHVIET